MNGWTTGIRQDFELPGDQLHQSAVHFEEQFGFFAGKQHIESLRARLPAVVKSSIRVRGSSCPTEGRAATLLPGPSRQVPNDCE